MNKSEDKYKNFNCKICLDAANEPVITPCGHLYCWPCIYQVKTNQTKQKQWSQAKGNPLKCPYCTNQFDINKVITLFNGEESQQKSQELPKRPQNPRTDPQNNNNNNNNAFGNVLVFPSYLDQWNFGFGIGFPFLCFTNFNMFPQNNNVNGNNAGGGWARYFPIAMFVLMILSNFLPAFYQYDDEYSSQRQYNTRQQRQRPRPTQEEMQEYQSSETILFVVVGALFFGLNFMLKKVYPQQQRV